MRLIDADRSDEIIVFDKQNELLQCSVVRDYCERQREFLNKFPTVDAVPVVRCRDCEHARKLKDNFYGWDFSCKHFNSRWVRSNDFCSYGERKDEVSE